MKKYLAILGIGIICCSYADNKIYQYTDSDGNLVLSNKPAASPYEDKRRQVLYEELSEEKTALKEANNMLAQNIKTAPSEEQKKRNSILKDTIKEHQKNIDILNKQLGYPPK